MTWRVHANPPTALICMTATGTTIIITRGFKLIIGEAKEDRPKRGNRTGANVEVGYLWK